MRTGKVIEERLVSPFFHSQPAHLSFTLILPPRVEWETGREMEKVCSLDHTPRPGMTEEAVDHHQNNSSVKAVGTSPLRSVQRTPQLLFQLLCRAESQWWERARGAWEQGKWLKNVSSRPSFTLNLPISPSLSSYHLELSERQDVKWRKCVRLTTRLDPEWPRRLWTTTRTTALLKRWGPRHCEASSVLRNCCFNCCAEQSRSVCSTAVESKTGESEVFLSLPSFILPKPSLQLYGFCGR